MQPQLPYSLAVWSGASGFTPLGFRLLICKIGITNCTNLFIEGVLVFWFFFFLCIPFFKNFIELVTMLKLEF